MPDGVRDSWKDRAEILNLYPVSGVLILLPNGLEGEEILLEGHMMYYLTEEWMAATKVFRYCLVWKPKNGRSLASYIFRLEKVIIHGQMYQVFYLNLLLKLSLFGAGYGKLRKNEVV